MIDRIFSDREREIQTFWHFHPDCQNVTINANGAVLSKDPGKGNVIIIPIQGNVVLQGQLAKGRESPEIQGWYSPEFNQWIASSDAVYSGPVPERGTFGWLIVPFIGTIPPAAEANLLVTFDVHVNFDEVI